MQLAYRLAWIGAALAAPMALAQGEIEELLVTAEPDSRRIDVTEALSVAPDPAQLLHAAPGANVTRNGPITSIPQYRGLFGPRIAVALDGNQLAPAGPNWMDPPISYAVTAQLEVLEVYRGIAPVRVAQETLGGAIEAHTRRMDFAATRDLDVQGRVMGSGQSVNSGYQLDAEVQAANDRQRLRAAFMRQDGDNAEFPVDRSCPRPTSASATISATVFALGITACSWTTGTTPRQRPAHRRCPWISTTSTAICSARPTAMTRQRVHT